MRLTDMHPEWLGSGGEGVSDKDGNPVPRRERIGLSFDCPCAWCTAQRTGDREHDFYYRVHVTFRNPPDGGPPFRESPAWERRGETFETLVLQPSILKHPSPPSHDDRMVQCQGWHGYIGGPGGDRPGEVVTV